MPNRRLIAGACVASLLAWGLPARSGSGAGAAGRPVIELARRPSPVQLVDQGVQAYYDGRYSKALKLLNKALNGSHLEATRRLGALQYKAFCQVALGQTTAARATFERILDLNPDFRLAAGTAPKIENLFEQVRAERPPPEPAPPPEPITEPELDQPKPPQEPVSDALEAIPPPPAEKEEGTSIHWWIWPVVAVVVAGACLAIGLTVNPNDEKTGSALVRFDLGP